MHSNGNGTGTSTQASAYHCIPVTNGKGSGGSETVQVPPP
jgi:hypothetical protein